MAELKAKFTKMTDGTPEDWSIIAESNINEAADLPGKILDHLMMLGNDYGGFAVDRLTHSIQTATRAHRDGRDEEYVVCALLHDIVEDTDYTIEDIEKLFGKKIATIISGLTKISDVFDQKVSLQAENFRKMLLTLSDDVRVILIKLADRLHNMRTLDAMSKQQKLKIASETHTILNYVSNKMTFGFEKLKMMMCWIPKLVML